MTKISKGGFHFQFFRNYSHFSVIISQKTGKSGGCLEATKNGCPDHNWKDLLVYISQ